MRGGKETKESYSHQWVLKNTPRRWQQEAFELWSRENHGVVRVVTGAGKTLLAQMCMLRFKEECPEGLFVIVVPTIALLDQWYISLLEDLGVPSDSIACYSGEESATEPKIINLMVLNTARHRAPAIAERQATFLIVDECHRSGSPVNSRALKGNHKAALGLSATPEREYDDGFTENISPALGPIIYEYDYLEAYRDAVITPFKLVNVRVDLLQDEQREYEKLTRLAARESSRLQNTQGPTERLKRLLQQRAAVSASASMRIPVAAKLVEQGRGQRTIVFHERIDKANALQNILSARSHNVALYHSGIGPAVRRDNLLLYRRGLFDVLVSCRALDEGTNVPETAVAVIASSTASTRQRIQRLGRALRPAPGKDSSTVYTIYATDQEEHRLLAEAVRLQGTSSVCWQRGSIDRDV